MSIGFKNCKFCGSPDCYGACMNQPPKHYHSICKYCGSSTCDMALCKAKAIKAAYDAAWADNTVKREPEPLPKGELIGYRCWNLGTFRTADPDLVEIGNQLAIPYAIVLRSLFNSAPWPGPVMHADRLPTAHNHHGIYTLKSDKQGYDTRAPVSGSVTMYGKIVEHRDGYRAEHAIVRGLTLHVSKLADHLAYPEPGQKSTVAKQIATLATVLERRYGCEVLIDTSEAELEPMEKLIRKIKQGNITAADLEGLAKEFGA